MIWSGVSSVHWLLVDLLCLDHLHDDLCGALPTQAFQPVIRDTCPFFVLVPSQVFNDHKRRKRLLNMRNWVLVEQLPLPEPQHHHHHHHHHHQHQQQERQSSLAAAPSAQPGMATKGSGGMANAFSLASAGSMPTVMTTPAAAAAEARTTTAFLGAVQEAVAAGAPPETVASDGVVPRAAATAPAVAAAAAAGGGVTGGVTGGPGLTRGGSLGLGGAGVPGARRRRLGAALGSLVGWRRRKTKDVPGSLVFKYRVQDKNKPPSKEGEVIKEYSLPVPPLLNMEEEENDLYGP